MIEFLSQAKHSRPESSTLRNETRAAGLHYFIESLSSLNAIDFVQCVFRKGRDVKILPRAGRGSRRCKESRATLYRPSQQHPCWRLSNSCGNCRNDWIFERPRPHAVTQWREGQKHDALLLAEFQKLRLRQIRMCFDLDHCRLDSRRFVNVGNSSCKPISDSPMARHLPLSTRLSIAPQVSSKVTPRS